MRTIMTLNNHTIEQGWSDDSARDIVEASREETIRTFTPNDAERRFRDTATAQEWYDNPDKLPIVYTLRDRVNRDLGGIAWFSRQRHEAVDPSCHTTFAIRLYDAARGHGVSYPFAEAVHDDFTSLHTCEGTPGIWLETSRDNPADLRLYEKLGYRTLTSVDTRIIMGRDV